MTEPNDLAHALKPRVEALEQERPTYRKVTVTATHPGTSTYDADVEGIGIVEGFSAPAHFLPAVGDEFDLPINGAVPGFQPTRIGGGAVGEDELAEPVKEQISVALDTANGKNKVTFSLLDAPGSGYVGTAGDVWFKRNGSGVITGSWEWDGTAWLARSFGDAVLNSLTVGKLVSGTGVFDMLMAGSLYSAASGSRYRIDAAGIRLYSGSDPTPTVDLNAVTGNATFRGTVEGALIRTSASGQRLEIQGGGTAGGRTLTFYPAGGGAAATVLSRDDGAGNAGITMEAGGTNRGFINFTSTFADIGFVKAGAAASFVRVSDDTMAVAIGVESGKGMSIAATAGVYLFSGLTMYGRLSTDGLERIHQFRLDGAATGFTFGATAGGAAADADVYALRFISTNPGATGGFIYFSDGRLKRNTRPVTFDALAQILATPVLEFEWESTGQTGFGFVAQQTPPDVQVRLSPDRPVDGVANPIGVAAEQMLAKVVRAVQQLDSKVEAMRVRTVKP